MDTLQHNRINKKISMETDMFSYFSFLLIPMFCVKEKKK